MIAGTYFRWISFVLFFALSGLAFAVDADPRDKRLLGIIPDARSSPSLIHYEPLSVKQKPKIASDDSFDRGTVALAAQSRWTNANPSFRQGIKGDSQYAPASYVDFAIGNMMTEGLYPSLLHQDPRYFRRGEGSSRSRLGCGAKQIFCARTDSGRFQLNYAEFDGNSTVVAISNAYHDDSRQAGDAVSKWGSQIAIDMAANGLTEFGPDVSRHFHGRNRKQ